MLMELWCDAVPQGAHHGVLRQLQDLCVQGVRHDGSCEPRERDLQLQELQEQYTLLAIEAALLDEVALARDSVNEHRYKVLDLSI